MTSSMPSSVLSKTLYSNTSTTNQRNNNTTNHGSKAMINKRNQVSKARQNPPDGGWYGQICIESKNRHHYVKPTLCDL